MTIICIALYAIVYLFFLINITYCGMVNVCSDIKDCVKCTESYVNIFTIQEHCRWCYKTETCSTPFSCPPGSPTAQRDAFKCPTKASNARGRRYTDKLGRSLYALTLAAKLKDPTLCLKNSRNDVKLIKYFEVECDQSHNTCAGMLAVSEEAKALYVIYRGTALDNQLFQEFVQGIGAQLGAWEKFVNETGVMTYFHGAFTQLFLKGGMKNTLLELKKFYEGYRVWVAGHSLGGSLASMTALYLINQTIFPSERVKLVTFGEPRTGNYKYAKAIEKNVGFRYRVINQNDLVTNTPQSIDPHNLLLPFSNAERQPYFYRYAVYYETKMEKNSTFKLCEFSEDHYCRNLALAVNGDDHLTYFNVKPDEYLKANCSKSMLL